MNKRRPRSSRSGFTLVELLVVIGIIAILAAVTSVAAGSAIKSAKRARASSIMQSIQAATVAFNTEYNIYPCTTTSPTTDTAFKTAADWYAFDDCLEGNINPLTAAQDSSPLIKTNTRNIGFFQPNKSDMDSTGAIKNPFLDANGNNQYFFMVVDTDYSGAVGDNGFTPQPPNFVGASTTNFGSPITQAVPGGVAVWCNCDQPLAAPTNAKFWVHTY